LKKKQITAELVEQFSQTFLVSKYDGSLDIPNIHREWWEMCCSKDRLVSIAAPRG